MKEKAAYLRGLIEGLGIDETTKEGKVIKAMSELLGELAEAVDGIDEDVTRAYDQINDLSDELEDLEADLYEDDEDDEDDEEPEEEEEDTEEDDNDDDIPVSRSMRWPAPTAARPFTSARMIWMQAKPTARTAA